MHLGLSLSLLADSILHLSIVEGVFTSVSTLSFVCHSLSLLKVRISSGWLPSTFIVGAAEVYLVSSKFGIELLNLFNLTLLLRIVSALFLLVFNLIWPLLYHDYLFLVSIELIIGLG